MPPRITSTSSRSTSFVAAAAAAASVVSLSTRYSSTFRPSKPPFALMSSMTILATLALATPINDSGPVWSVMTPTLIADDGIALSSQPFDASGSTDDGEPSASRGAARIDIDTHDPLPGSAASGRRRTRDFFPALPGVGLSWAGSDLVDGSAVATSLSFRGG